MKTHTIVLTALFAVAVTLGSMAVRADDEGKGKVVISTTAAPAAIGPYSQGIRVGKTLYLASQIAIDPATNTFMTGASIQDQTTRVLENLAAVAAAAGMTLDDMVNTTVYLADLADFAAMNAVYATFFKTAPPARATLQVAGLPKGAKIAISGIAVDSE